MGLGKGVGVKVEPQWLPGTQTSQPGPVLSRAALPAGGIPLSPAQPPFHPISGPPPPGPDPVLTSLEVGVVLAFSRE